MTKFLLPGATKLYFAHYSCVVIIFYNKDLCKSAFSTYYFRRLVFHLFVFYVFSVCCEFSIRCLTYRIHNIYVIIAYISDVWLSVMLQHMYLTSVLTDTCKKHVSREDLSFSFEKSFVKKNLEESQNIINK